MVKEIVSFVVLRISYFSRHLVLSSSKLVSKLFQPVDQLSNVSSSETPTVPGISKGFCASLSLFVLIKFVLVKNRLLAI